MSDAGPLRGLRVVEVAGGVPAAFCSRLLRGFGAEVVRAEGPAIGAGPELTTGQQAFLLPGAHRATVADTGGLADLVAGADVVVEDRGPGFLERAGLPGTRRPGRSDLVVTSISPFGHTGPRANWQATSAVQFAAGGLMSLTGEPHRPPLVTGGDQAWMFGGLQAFAATVVTLFGRWRRGGGDWLDLSLQEVAASIPELYGPMSEYELKAPVTRAGNSVRAVWGVYHCADGFAGVCCLERQVPAFFALLGSEVQGNPDFADPASRTAHDDELLAHVLPFMLERTKDELVALSPEHRVPFGAVRTARELLADEAFAERGFLDRVETPWGRATVPGRPFPGLGWRPPEPTTERAGAAGDGGAWRSPGWRTTAASSPARADERPEAPLSGVRVLDLTMMWAGPYATKLLAETGADVIKIESPRAWDNIRTLVRQDPSIPDPWNSAYYFNEYNHSKRSLTLDLAQEAGHQVFLRLVAGADVVIENYRADVLDNLGLGYEVLRAANQRIVLVSMAGFGKTGPLARHVGFGPIIEMMSGLMSLTGYGDDGIPVKTGVSYGDPVGGTSAVAAVALALLQRDRTGTGCHVDLAQREAAAVLAGPAFAEASLGLGPDGGDGAEPIHWGNRHPHMAPQGCYPAAGDDAWMVLSVRHNADWQALAHLIGRPDLAGLTLDQRRAAHDELDGAIAAWTAGRPADAAAAEIQAAGVPAAAVVDTLAIHDDPQLVARGFWRQVPNPKMRPYRQSGPTWRFKDAPAHEMRRSPWFGEHNTEILAELGLSDAEQAALAEAQVIADAPVNPSVG
ncbi:MAG: CoA transferase [Acidimicrobiia bacterium]|nr:CoA transferase [Acidimicrobiia bacterium]